MTVKALAVLAAASILAAQQPPPTFRSEIKTVHVDVSVLDRGRRPVRGLNAGDFTILEDGRPQEIAVFQAVEIPEVRSTSAAWTREVASDVVSNDAPPERRLFLIVMDDMTLQENGRAKENAKRIASRVVDQLGPADVAAVVFTRDNRHAQDYTADRARLRAAVDHVTAGFRDMGAFDPMTGRVLPGQDDYFYENSVRVLQDAVKYLSLMPDRRKVMVYVGQGLPFDPDLLAPAPVGMPAGGGASPIQRQLVMTAIRNALTNAFRDAGRANVNVYTLDVCGLRVPAPQVGSRVPPTCEPGLEIDYLKTVANATGGRAITDTDDFEPGVRSVFAENASYYLLGFRPAAAQVDGKYHRIEVRVNRPDVHVRTRSGYQEDTPKDARQRAAADAAPLDAAIAGAVPKTDLPMLMSAVAFDVPGQRSSAVAVTIALRQPVRKAGAIERVELLLSAFDVNGKAFGRTRLNADVKIRDGASGQAEYEVLTRIDLPPGRYQLRGAARMPSLGVSGSLYRDVDVPDVEKPAVTVSGLVFDASPRPIISPRDALNGVLAIVPTNRRAFDRADHVAAFVRVYQGGKRPLRTIPLRVRIVDRDGATVMDRSDTLSAQRFERSRSTDVQFDVPVGSLRAGDYLLTIDADGGAAVREGRFRVN